MNIKQIQCLLEYLGYYAPENSNKINNVDGLWGPASDKAVRAFQADYGLDADGIVGPLTESMLRQAAAGTAVKAKTDWSKVKYFTREEFRCQCGGKYCGGFPYEMDARLMAAADQVRAHFGAPAIVSSGVRCQEHNRNVGGVPNSRHLYGKAMDFTVSGVSAEAVLTYVRTLPQIAYAYAIDPNYVHMDVE